MIAMKYKITVFAFACLASLSLGLKDTLTVNAMEGTGHTIGFGELEEEWRGEM